MNNVRSSETGWKGFYMRNVKGMEWPHCRLTGRHGRWLGGEEEVSKVMSVTPACS